MSVRNKERRRNRMAKAAPAKKESAERNAALKLASDPRTIEAIRRADKDLAAHHIIRLRDLPKAVEARRRAAKAV